MIALITGFLVWFASETSPLANNLRTLVVGSKDAIQIGIFAQDFLCHTQRRIHIAVTLQTHNDVDIGIFGSQFGLEASASRDDDPLSC